MERSWGNSARLLTITALTVMTSLGAGTCANAPLPENYLNEIFKGDPATHCGKWLDAVSDLYIEKMKCQGSSIAHTINEEVEFRGRKWTPIKVGIRSLESLLAPLVGAEDLFKDAKTGRPRDLFEGTGIVMNAVIPENWARLKVEKEPPAALMAMDLALGPARDDYWTEWKKLGPEPWSFKITEPRRQLQGNGPFQKAFLPIARLLREKCSAQIAGGASLVARIAQVPACQDTLAIDPFLKALLGPGLGQNLTAPERSAHMGFDHKSKRGVGPAVAGTTATPGGALPVTPSDSGAAR